jgi:hypothetical protein
MLIKNQEYRDSWVWWHTYVILVLERLKQEDGEVKANLGYIVRPFLEKK